MLDLQINGKGNLVNLLAGGIQMKSILVLAMTVFFGGQANAQEYLYFADHQSSDAFDQNQSCKGILDTIANVQLASSYDSAKSNYSGTANANALAPQFFGCVQVSNIQNISYSFNVKLIIDSETAHRAIVTNGDLKNAHTNTSITFKHPTKENINCECEKQRLGWFCSEL